MINKKISVCLNGEIDNLDKVFLLKKNLDYKFNNLCDYFIHTWEKSFNIDEYIKYINPKKSIIDNNKIYNSRVKFINELAIKYEQNSLIPNDIIKIYSTMRSGELKKDYEIENNIEYDLCININIKDSIITEDNMSFFNSKITKNSIYTNSFTNIGTFPFERISYDMYMSDSETFDILTSFYKFLPLIKEDIFDKNITISEVFAYYIRMFKINIKN